MKEALMTTLTAKKPKVTKDVERWQASRWDQIVGNKLLKEYLWDMIWCIRMEGHISGFNALITGPSRGGKTSTVRFGIKCIGCLKFDFETMNPCGDCSNCNLNHHLYGNDGWENHIDVFNDDNLRTPIRYHHMPLDCSRLNETQIEDCIQKIRINDENLRIITLDEVHRLSRRSMDERLLKPVEDFPAIWIAMSANVKKEDDNDLKKLEKMFQNRFTYRINTQKPTVPEMMVWLAERCEDFGITCESPKATLKDLAERCNQLPGMALQVLNKAHKRRSKQLDAALVESHVFDLDD